MQETFDWLYQRGLDNRTKGINLYDLIVSENNILLAYRMIKRNTGAKTCGVDKQTIEDFKIVNRDAFIKEIRQALENYHPHDIVKIEIPKPNGKTRPLGIPTMRDRLIQQMFKQILEPICEAKFYKHSYGFRPNRSTEHAIARCATLANAGQCHYVVDIDIKGFFDNVNHNKLLKQLYTIGVKDKRVLTIISKMLKTSERGFPASTKGTTQGSILSPLLSNVVLNDLDWWITTQREDFPTRHPYSTPGIRSRYLRKNSKLKLMHIVRYADDFKIYTNSPKSAQNIFHAVKQYLENHLSLSISDEKSSITNLRKRYTEFLGFELKVEKRKKSRYVNISRVSKKSKKRIKKEVREKIKTLRRCTRTTNALRFNLYVLGIHNYYQKATRVNLDFKEIHYSCLFTLYNRLKHLGEYGIPRSPPSTYKNRYKTTYKTMKIVDVYLYPLADVRWKLTRCFSQGINNYTENGRKERHRCLKPTVLNELYKMSIGLTKEQNLELLDNKYSRYSMQNGKCAVTKLFLTAEVARCHHVIPKSLGGTHKFNNLVIIHEWVHTLIHATRKETIDRYLTLLQPSDRQLEKINNYHKSCNLAIIH